MWSASSRHRRAANPKLKFNRPDLPDQTKQLATGAAQVATGSAALSSQLKSSSPTMATNTAQLRALLASELPAGSPGLAAFDSYASGVSGAFTRTSGAVDKLAAGSASVSAGTDKLAAGVGDITTGFTAAASGAHQISSGAAQVSDGSTLLATKLADAATGASSLATGLSTIADKEAELATGLDQLSTGSDQLHTGLGSMNDGLGKLVSGSHELAGKLSQAVADVPALTATQRDANATVMSSPVSLDTTYVHEAEGVGEGMAPYFIGLSLYVGAMIMWMLLRPLSQRLLAAPVPAGRVVVQNATPAVQLGALQVAFLAATLLFGLGLHVNHLAAFVAFALLVSAAFVTLQQALNIWLGTSVGRLATLVLLMLQLTSAGGTYPVITSDPFFQVLHQIMPMTQVVNGLREAITGDLNATFQTAVAALVAVVIGSLVLSVWGAARSRTWTISRLHPAVAI